MKLKTLFLVGAVAGAFAVLGCGDNPPPPTGDGGSGGNGTGGTGGGNGACTDGELCCIEACVINENFRSVCLDEYNDCTGLGGDPGQCRIAAEETCTA